MSTRICNSRTIISDHETAFPGNLDTYPSQLTGRMTAQEWEAFVDQIRKAREPLKENERKDCLAQCFCCMSFLGFFLIIPPIIGCYVNHKQGKAKEKLNQEFEETYKKILADHSDSYKARGISFSEQTEKYQYDKGYDRDDEWRGMGWATRRFLVVTVQWQ